MMIRGGVIWSVGDEGKGGNALSSCETSTLLEGCSNPGGGVMVFGVCSPIPSRAKAREASISISRSKLDKVSRVVLPSRWLSAEATLVLELKEGERGEGGRLVEGFVFGFGIAVRVGRFRRGDGVNVSDGEVDVEVCEVDVGEVDIFNVEVEVWEEVWEEVV